VKDIFLWVLLPLILAEAILIGPWLSERLLQWGARRLPEQYRERYTEDWLGELDAVPGSLIKLAFAVRVLVRVPATQQALTGQDSQLVLAVKRLLALVVTGLLLLLQFTLRLGGRLARSRWEVAVRDKEVVVARTRQKLTAHLVDPSSPRFLPSTPLYETSLSSRAVKILSDAGIRTCGQLLYEYEGTHQVVPRTWNRDLLLTEDTYEVQLIVQTLIHARLIGSNLPRYRPTA
jgi:hypothetical protein